MSQFLLLPDLAKDAIGLLALGLFFGGMIQWLSGNGFLIGLLSPTALILALVIFANLETFFWWFAIYYLIMIAPGMINGFVNEEKEEGSFVRGFCWAFFIPLAGWLVMWINIQLNKKVSNTVSGSRMEH